MFQIPSAKVLWLMPIQPISKEKRKGTLGSYYSIADYKAVNPEFGTAADFKALVDKAHGMGFKIVLDWVPNHTGWDNPWITKNPEWYTKDASGKIIHPEGTDWTDVADLNYSNMDMRSEMIDSMKYWIEEFPFVGTLVHSLWLKSNSKVLVGDGPRHFERSHCFQFCSSKLQHGP